MADDSTMVQNNESRPATGFARGGVVYRFCEAAIAVEPGDEGSERWLREFVTPWFTAEAARDTDPRVRVVTSAARFAELATRQARSAVRPIPCFSLASALVSYPGWDEPDGARVIADGEYGCYYRVLGREIEILARPQNRLARVGLLRVLRELATLGALAAPEMLDLHAAACVYGDLAVVLVGGKRAGKTTLLAHLLSSGEAALLTNDRLLVETGSRRAFGVPVLVPVREDTERRFPALGHGLPRQAGLLHADERAQRDAAGAEAGARLVLSPAQFAGQLGAATAASARVGVIVFPEISSSVSVWSLHPLPRDEGVVRLCRGLYANGPGPREPTIFQSVTGRAADPAARMRLAQQLAGEVPLATCLLGPNAYRGQARAWLRALPLDKADGGP
ncbi:MAG: hypothetical protein JXP73_17155 [Deltaproteobacteria bacterium]|nr:hypothetical protein [Deltaproteobacteria bacterium]